MSIEAKLKQLSPQKRKLIEQRLKGRVIDFKDEGQPQRLIVDTENRNESYPLRSFQQRQVKLAKQYGVAPWFFLETENRELDPRKFIEALQLVISCHSVFTTQYQDDNGGCFRDGMLSSAARSMDLSTASTSEIEKHLDEVRYTLSPVNKSCSSRPLEVICVQLPAGISRLFFSVNLLLFDLVSIEFMALQCRQIYEGRRLITDIPRNTFRDYICTENSFLEESREAKQSREYWLQKSSKPDSRLNSARFKSQPAQNEQVEKYYYSVNTVERAAWKQLKTHASANKLTGSMSVYALFNLVLSRMASLTQFDLEVRLFNRIAFASEINDILGQYSSGIINSISIEPTQPLKSFCEQIENTTWKDLDRAYFDMASSEYLSENAHSPLPAIVFTSTISRYEEFVEEGAIPPMKWFGKTRTCIATNPGQMIELLLVENDGLLELHWFCNDNHTPPEINQNIREMTTALVNKVASDPRYWFETKLQSLLNSTWKQSKEITA